MVLKSVFFFNTHDDCSERSVAAFPQNILKCVLGRALSVIRAISYDLFVLKMMSALNKVCINSVR